MVIIVQTISMLLRKKNSPVFCVLASIHPTVRIWVSKEHFTFSCMFILRNTICNFDVNH